MTIRFKVFQKSRTATRRAADSGYSRIYVRLRDGREIDQTVRTDILVRAECWDNSHDRVKAKASYDPEQRAFVDSSVSSLKAHITTAYISDKIDGRIGSLWLQNCINSFYKNPGLTSFGDLFDEFLRTRELSAQRIKQYRSLENAIHRYEVYVADTRKCSYVFEISRVEEKDLNDLWAFLADEHELCKASPKLTAMYPDGKEPRPRGKNTINDMFKKLRAFFNWCVHEGHIKVSPFDNYHITQELYGTPVSLTTEEVRTIANKDFGKKKGLAQQRDVFVFQCNIGCRVSDLLRLRKSDIENGKISFIPSKTIKENARTVTVPLNGMAKAIVNKYAGQDQDGLLPFISVQKYNNNIKKILRVCGITREVTILDPLTRREKRVPICDVASSHMARRTFVNNIYKQVKDPALVSALTGHVEGSRAFSRYRDIDENLKRELVGLLE